MVKVGFEYSFSGKTQDQRLQPLLVCNQSLVSSLIHEKPCYLDVVLKPVPGSGTMNEYLSVDPQFICMRFYETPSQREPER